LASDATQLASEVASKVTNPVSAVRELASAAVGDEPELEEVEMVQLKNPEKISQQRNAAAQGGTMSTALQPMREYQAGKPVLTGEQQISSKRTRFHYDSVSLNGLAGWICPEEFPSRMPVDMTQRTAIAGSIWTQTFTTNASGNLGIYVFPWAICNSASNVNMYPFALVLDAAGFNPVTGNNGAVPTTYAGPLYPVVANIQAYRLNAASLRVTCIPSLTTSQGQVQVGYFTDYPNSSFPGMVTNGPTIPQSSLSSMTNYQLINLKTLNVRATSVIDGPADLTMMENGGTILGNTPILGSEGWYVLVTGAPPSTGVITITFSYSVEYLPTVTSLPMLNVLYSEPGPATLSLISNIIKAAPQILRLNLEQARSLAQSVMTSDSTKHDHLINMLLDRIEGYSMNEVNTSPYVTTSMNAGFFRPELELPEGPDPRIYE